jgi:hypothetical protein
LGGQAYLQLPLHICKLLAEAAVVQETHQTLVVAVAVVI